MKKILLIILLTAVSSIEYIAKAQGFKAEERHMIVNYVNCYYTTRYILNNENLKKEKEAIEKYKINIDYIEDAYEYDTLYKKLIGSGVLDNTAERLTKKLNDRNSSVTDSIYIVDYINKVTDTNDFSNFKFTEEDKSKLADKILQWYISRHSKVESPRENRSNENADVNPVPVPQNEMGFPNWYLWLSVGFSIVCLVVITLMMRKNRILAGEIASYDEKIRNKDDQPRHANRKWDEVQRKQSEADKNKEAEDTNVTNEVFFEITNDIQKNTADEAIPEQTVMEVDTTTYYADVDVSNGCFVRVNDKSTRKSVYEINVRKQSFTLINDSYEAKLSRVSSSGVTNACEVKGSYETGKTVSITPGKVQQDENGKWRIINKAIIEIK